MDDMNNTEPDVTVAPLPDAAPPTDIRPDEPGMDGEGVVQAGVVDIESARLARDERLRLLPEYMEHFFLEDLPPLDPADPWNQGIYMRFRINQYREANNEEPVE